MPHPLVSPPPRPSKKGCVSALARFFRRAFVYSGVYPASIPALYSGVHAGARANRLVHCLPADCVHGTSCALQSCLLSSSRKLHGCQEAGIRLGRHACQHLALRKLLCSRRERVVWASTSKQGAVACVESKSAVLFLCSETPQSGSALLFFLNAHHTHTAPGQRFDALLGVLPLDLLVDV